MDRKELFKSY